jgi:hypothetical protein
MGSSKAEIGSACSPLRTVGTTRFRGLAGAAKGGRNALAAKPQSTGAIVMAITKEDFYRSSNGDRWRLVRDTDSGKSFVRHEPNLSSGGRITDTEVEEFLERTGSSPQNLALRALLDREARTDGS